MKANYWLDPCSAKVLEMVYVEYLLEDINFNKLMPFKTKKIVVIGKKIDETTILAL